jgi:hypothetical protein
VATPQGPRLSTAELERALGLLEQAERDGRPYAASPLALHLLFTLAGLVGVFACPLGALIRLVDARLGQPLLVVGLAAAALFTLLSTQRREGAWLSVVALRAAWGAEAVSPVRSSATRPAARLARIGRRLVLVLGLVSLAAGLAWLVYAVAALYTALPIPLALVAWPLAGVLVLTAVHGYREHRFYAAAARLRRALAARYVEARRAEAADVTLLEAEARAWGQIQRRLLETGSLTAQAPPTPLHFEA